MLVPMRRIEIVAPRRDADVVLRTLHRIGTVQLVPYEPGSAMAASVFAPGDPWASHRWEELRQQVAAVRDSLGSNGARPGLVAELWALSNDELEHRAATELDIRDAIAERQSRRQALLGEHARLSGYRRIVESLRPVVGRLPALRGYGSSAVVIRARYRPILATLRDELETLTAGRCEMIAADIGGDRIAALLVYPRASASEVQALLGGRDLEEVTLPPELAGLPFEELVARLAQRAGEVETDLERIDGQLIELAERHAPALAALCLVIDDRLAETRALQTAGTSDHLVALSGWVPVDELDSLRETLAGAVDGRVWVEEREPSRAERADAPVAIRNGPLVQAFARIASFVSLPRYGTIDPTPTLALMLPVFIGLMVGDVGYGLLLVAIMLFVRRRWGERVAWVPKATTVGMIAAISTIIFGVLFGEAFGDAGHALLGMRPLLFDRHEAVAEFLLLALALGSRRSVSAWCSAS
jgi:V/A-type H+/Na+-transporting ATPase subunit I